MRNTARVSLNFKLFLKTGNFGDPCVRGPAVEEGITRLAGVIDPGSLGRSTAAVRQ